MIINKIRYKKKIDFDYFEIWMGEEASVFDHELFEVEGKFEDLATCVSTQICPWCAKKYGLYSEVERTPESIDEEIKFYSNEDPKKLDRNCGIDGCMNGAADYVDLDWSDFEIVERK
jgi:hypothetical protein